MFDNGLALKGGGSGKGLYRIYDPGSARESWVYVEFKPYEISRRRPRSSQETMKRARCLANLLRHAKAAEAGFHTLPFRCIIQQAHPSPRLAFIFDLPSELGPDLMTLSEAIEGKYDNEIRPTLGERFKMARSLAETLFQFHSVGWLHKSIRSENILLFRDPKTQALTYSYPYLVGFEFSRDVTDSSTVEHDGLLERNIYRHPDRQGPPEDAPGNRFNVLHDIYALGVVLLEIGLWKPVVGYEEWRDFRDADERKSMLEEHAGERLPHYMGRVYTDAVSACLKGEVADEIKEEPSNDVEREKVLLAFWERVVGGTEIGVHLR
ncbi:hypothetical protein AOQ84DRAFT_357323 [Glonium stellatum]|uniref:Protein kinase domain-containing protein n=1 Tax=Glonium stellatum TaxID=574774 RepID=A0A8E2JM86_9PEZI|nr:hypothetical protein AOQ84DRAFT_357323 [Glonium stellatum]